MQLHKTLFLIGCFFIVSCNKNEKETNISSYNKTESHNMGQNCMNCHKSGGKGEGIFQAAGTVYDSTLSVTPPNTTVYLYTEQGGNGTLKHTVEVDGLGNFYTTESIDFGDGLYPTIKGTTTSKHMSSPITSGQCNSCHGVSTSKLWTK
jgi:hypothetical protein